MTTRLIWEQYKYRDDGYQGSLSDSTPGNHGRSTSPLRVGKSQPRLTLRGQHRLERIVMVENVAEMHRVDI